MFTISEFMFSFFLKKSSGVVFKSCWRLRCLVWFHFLHLFSFLASLPFLLLLLLAFPTSYFCFPSASFLQLVLFFFFSGSIGDHLLVPSFEVITVHVYNCLQFYTGPICLSVSHALAFCRGPWISEMVSTCFNRIQEFDFVDRSLLVRALVDATCCDFIVLCQVCDQS